MSNTTNTNGVSESQLVELLKQGNEDAFGILLQRFKSKLFGVAFGITQDREESLDIVQEVFLKAFEKIQTFRGDSSLSTWLRRITINQCLSNRRKQKPSRSFDQLSNEGFDPSPSESFTSPETDWVAKEEREEVQRIIRCLDEKHYLVMVLRYYLDLSYEEIAEALKIPVGIVRSRLHNAIKTIRRESGLRKNSEGEVC